MRRICLIPNVYGVGGMVTFQANLAEGLCSRGFEISHDLNDGPFEAVLVTGGTRDLPGLLRIRRQGVRIVQRLDGINWLHRRCRTGLRHFIRAEYGNRLLSTIRSHLATHIVYQSGFARGWWEDRYGPTPVPNIIIHNGVDLRLFTPDGPHERPTERSRLLIVEGTMGGGYELGLETTIRLAERITEKYPLELMIVGRLTRSLQARYQAHSRVPILWTGLLPRRAIPEIDRSAHLLYSADVNPACPNSVLEAMACGLPVLAFETGALAELVTDDAGRLVPLGSDPWKLEPPDVTALAEAAAVILSKQTRFRRSARARAEQEFGLDRMIDKYLEVLLGD